MSGNEAIGQACLDYGIRYATGYPGSPVTELGIFLASSLKDGLRFEWSINEAVALEKAFAASWIGLPTLVFMKEPGFNVCLDAFRAMAEKETEAGLLLVLGSDPQPDTSQTSQDSRGIVADAQVPLLEPSDATECFSVTLEALRISADYRLPVVLRINPFVAHIRELVSGARLPNRKLSRPPTLVIDRPLRYVTSIPTYLTDVRHRSDVLSRLASREANLNEVKRGTDAKIGIVVSHLIYRRIEVALSIAGVECDVLGLRLAWPIPDHMLEEFLAKHERICVFEEQMPFLETEIQAFAQRRGLRCEILGKRNGDLTPFKAGTATVSHIAAVLRRIFGKGEPKVSAENKNERFDDLLIPRVPTFCPGCPHPAFHFALNYSFDDGTSEWIKRENLLRSSDTGCYGSLGSYMGFGDLKFHMGAGFGCLGGLRDCAAITRDGETVSHPVLLGYAGDSTFLHGSLARLIDSVVNGVVALFVVFDNRRVAMASGIRTPSVDIMALCKALGLPAVRTHPQSLRGLARLVDSLLERVAGGEANLLIAEGSCSKVDDVGNKGVTTYKIDHSVCTKCGFCVESFPCPGLVWSRLDEYPVILRDICTGCGRCAEVCRFAPNANDGKNCQTAIVPCSPVP